MNVVALTYTTTREKDLKYLRVALLSFLKYNHVPVKVYTDNKEKVLSLNIKGIEVLEYSGDYDLEYKTENKTLPPKEVMSAFIDIFEKNSDYDVLFRFDTDTLFLGEVDFLDFYNSEDEYRGCVEPDYLPFAKKYHVSYTEITSINTGLSMIKGASVKNIKTRLKKYKDMHLCCPEMDMLSLEFKGKDDPQFFLDCRDRNPCNPKAVHFVGRDDKTIPRFKPFEEFSLQELRGARKNIQIYQNYKEFCQEIGEECPIPELYSLPLSDKRITLYSSCSGNIEKYYKLGVVCITSFKKHYSGEPLDWIILGEQDELHRLRDLFYPLSSDNITIKVQELPPTDFKDYQKYNSFQWCSEKASEIFMRRIQFVDHIFYETAIQVDFDTVFLRDMWPIIQDFNQSSAVVGGPEEEGYNIMYEIVKLRGEYIPGHEFKHYINFGFGMLNIKNFPQNWLYRNFLEFINKTKGIEDYYNTQEQACYALLGSETSFKLYPIQMLIYPRLENPFTRKKRKIFQVHYTGADVDLLTKPLDVKDLDLQGFQKYKVCVILKYYHIYVNAVLETDLPEDFKKLVQENLKKIRSLDFRKEFRDMGLQEL